MLFRSCNGESINPRIEACKNICTNIWYMMCCWINVKKCMKNSRPPCIIANKTTAPQKYVRKYVMPLWRSVSHAKKLFDINPLRIPDILTLENA